MKFLQIVPLPVADPEIGRWLWALEETRKRTLNLSRGLDQKILDWEGPDGLENAIGSLLYHLALIEMDWLFRDLLGREIPPEVLREFPNTQDREAGRLVRVLGISFERHEARLLVTRQVFLAEFKEMPPSRWQHLCQPVDRPDYECTPEWVVFHLVEHEAGHAHQISAIRTRARRHFERK